jgi:hypothetical protein
MFNCKKAPKNLDEPSSFLIKTAPPKHTAEATQKALINGPIQFKTIVMPLIISISNS